MVLFVVFFAVPAVLNFVFAFTNWNAFNDNLSWIGWDNFALAAENGSLWNGMRTTLQYAFLVVLLQNILGLAFALALEESTKANGVLRVFIFLPVLLAPLTVGYIFKPILAFDGVLNRILGTLTGSPVQIEWLGDPAWTLPIVAAIHAWKFFGMSALFYIAGLSAVPREQLEAARIDGAGYWRTFAAIKWPLLAPAVTINLSLAFVGTMSAADVIIATTNGGPARSTEVLSVFIFQQYGAGYYGFATAMSLTLFLAVLVLAVPLIYFLRKREIRA